MPPPPREPGDDARGGRDRGPPSDMVRMSQTLRLSVQFQDGSWLNARMFTPRPDPWIWLKLGSRQPSVLGKFAFALFFMALAFLVLVPAGAIAQSGDGIRVSPMWLIASYFLSELGEVALYPVGLSAVSKLSPPRIVGLMMGLWFLALGLGDKLAGSAAGFINRMPLESLFATMAGFLIAGMIVLLILLRPVRRAVETG